MLDFVFSAPCVIRQVICSQEQHRLDEGGFDFGCGQAFASLLNI
jgi:hypothetical protein